MKKLFLSVAILAAFASCSKNEVLDGATSKSISFTSLNDNVTRAETEGQTSGQANDQESDYKVYAVTSSVNDAWYIDGTINTDRTGTNVTYYWPNVDGETTDFYAYAPADAATATATPISVISVEYAVDGLEDFTVATPIEDREYYDGDDNTTDSNAVDFVFSHMLAKVTVQVALSESLTKAGYTLGETNTAVIGVNESVGTVDVMAKIPAMDNAESKTEATYDANLDTYYVLPQGAEGCTVQATGVTIYNSLETVIHSDKALLEYKISAENAKLFDETTSSFVAGKAYVITLTITDLSSDEEGDPLFGGSINFSASMVNWDEVGVGLTQG
ncbi:MAG: fimbrillin family protein [Rikenellaceae bacterium]